MNAPTFFYRHSGLGSVLATGTNVVATFLIFRLAYRELGPSTVGIWALIQGIMLISRLGDGGSGGNVTRLVAIDRSLQGSVRLRNFLISGALLGTAPIILLGLIILYPTVLYLTGHYSQTIGSNAIFSLTFSSLLFGIFTSANTIFAGCLDGLGLMALRGYLACLANALFVPIGYIAVREFGNPGLGFAYVTYSLVMTAFFALALFVFNPAPSASYNEQSVHDIARKTLHFNLGYFSMSISQLLMDPACKLLMSKFGNLDTVAIFDLANKVTSQARVLWQAVAQSILPQVSRDGSSIDEMLYQRMQRWTRFIARSALYTMGTIVAVSGYLAIFTLGGIRADFTIEIMMLGLANALNAAGLIGYYVDIGSGQLRRLVGTFIGMAVANIALGAIFGMMMGPPGIVLGYGLALAGAGLTCGRNIIGHGKQLFSWITRELHWELALFAGICLIAWIAEAWNIYANAVIGIVVTLVMLALLATAFAFREGENVLNRIRSQTFGQR